MTLFELVKQNICVPDAAEHYGLQVNRNGMCHCPFHEDRHPSMKLNERCKSTETGCVTARSMRTDTPA